MFLLAALVPAGAFASATIIDYSAANSGTVSVTYNDSGASRYKVGIAYAGSSAAYYDYTPNTTETYSLDGGSGRYSVALFVLNGGAYVSVASVSFTATISAAAPTASSAVAVSDDVSTKYAAYLKSVKEITFASNDSVSKKAAELTKDCTTDQKKILAIYNYIAKNFKYDYSFADKVKAGTIRTYCPDPVSVLSNKKGVCYDFSSLFAAMCRSVGIPCKLVKGYSTKINGYHAWNSVYDSKTDKWYTIDLTLAVCNSNKTASKFSKCCMADKNYTAKSSV